MEKNYALGTKNYLTLQPGVSSAPGPYLDDEILDFGFGEWTTTLRHWMYVACKEGHKSLRGRKQTPGAQTTGWQLIQ